MVEVRVRCVRGPSSSVHMVAMHVFVEVMIVEVVMDLVVDVEGRVIVVEPLLISSVVIVVTSLLVSLEVSEPAFVI